ncbi:MAG: epoxyqueuosine reductase QueH [Candidatus Aminicenantes bacterium]|nr:epoxyqueuosine reductase QueH [Candidatus Aminicenantes bacterium]
MLAHVCCAPDALYVVALLQEDHAVTGLFDNPNIWPESEYALRLAEARKVERLLGFRLLEGPYEPAAWFAATRAYSDAPERGPRCRICYALRLERTARLARRMGISAFTTIMSVSPWKRADILNQIGRRLGRKHGLTFLEADFKKKNGFQRSVELSRAHGLYRQNYCGCRSSLRPRPLSVSP